MSIRPDSYVEIIREFKITIINTLRALVQKVDIMREELDNAEERGKLKKG